MPLWHPRLWEILQTRTYLERKTSVSLGAQVICGSKSFAMPTQELEERHNIPFRPALVGLWHLDGRSFLEQFLESLF